MVRNREEKRKSWLDVLGVRRGSAPVSAVFVSCSDADQALGGYIVHGFRRAGIEVWWREEMPGVDWRRALEQQIAELGAIVALWTATSRDEPAVKEAARLGLAAGKLVNALSGAITPPFPYGSVEGATLDGWEGGDGHPGWMRLVEVVKTRVAPMILAATDRPREVEAPVGSTSARESVGVLDGGSEPVRASETGGWNTDGGADAKVNPGAGDVALLPQLPAPNGIGWLVARRVLAVGLAAWAVVIALGLFHIYTRTNNPSALPPLRLGGGHDSVGNVRRRVRSMEEVLIRWLRSGCERKL